MEIKLQKQNIKNLLIEGKNFCCDCNSLKSVEAVNRFAETYRTGNISFGDELLSDCKLLVNDVLGDEAWNELFDENENSLAPYYLCLELVRIYSDEFMKDEKERQKKESDKAMSEAKEVMGNLQEFAKTVEYTNKKYGGSNAMVNSKRTAKKHRNKR